ncbi:MAG: hypothetical protein A2046_01765 [Bacteroidetes bacterium GWA2_30_7]|nr:MAG: hypothetical protein A2046_01765 [Bacteroidetes bacterium GWA2_30_7]
MQFIEVNKTYEFNLIDEIDFFSNEKYYILCDPFNRKHLLNSNIYLEYNYKIGDKILCKVDKINCQGRVYIEPEHPIYKIGNYYDFKFLRKDKIRNKRGDLKNVLIFEDLLGKEANSYVSDLDFFNNFKKLEVNARVVKIKKAQVYIELKN